MGRQCRTCLGYDSFALGDPSGTRSINVRNVSRKDSYGISCCYSFTSWLFWPSRRVRNARHRWTGCVYT
uniref:Uncharacterized protein n=1 Tax=Picea sitchensis TaxID=3332 RepID=A9NVH4_PICSI|nr:unknown [Picea sitchensis]